MPYYVGKGSGRRVTQKTGRAVPPPREKSNIVFVARNLSESSAFALEVALIAQYGRIDNGTGCLRNGTNGGDGASGLIHSQETKQHLSEWMKAHPNRGNALFSSNIWPKGKLRGPQSEEMKEKRAQALRGGKRTAETRARMSVAHQGKKFSDEHRANLSVAARARRGVKRNRPSLSDEHRARISQGLFRHYASTQL